MQSTSPLRKTAIAVPADVLDAIDAIARERHESRSRFVTRVLRAALRARRDQDITRALTEVFADPPLAAEQRQAAFELDDIGTAWADERW